MYQFKLLIKQIKLKKVLSLDGGGIRGIISASIIAHLEARLQVATNDQSARISDFFDLLSGTSAGGILTALYLVPGSEVSPGEINKDKAGAGIQFRPKYTAAQALEYYEELGPVLFSRSFKQLIFSGWGVFRSRYRADALYDFAHKILGDTYISEVAKDCLITSYDLSTRKALLFSKYSVRKYGSMADYKLCDIVRATSAAPSYFPPAQIFAKDNSPRHLVDGGVYANNPSMCAVVESIKLWPELTLKDYWMLSVGTGKVVKPYFYDKTKKFGYIDWLVPIIDILMSSVAETVGYEAKQMFTAAGVPDNYVRIEPPILSADIRMDNARQWNIRALKNAAQNYIDHNSDVFDRVIADLTSK
ncbi:MAG: Patatin family protein [uncultured bacterium]|nr:MAG: Patatin family protein [uncultured bacterium]HBY01691.1 patatin [Rikenellaceae bacterium]